MASLNRVILIGNLGKDPEIKTTPSGLQIANFSLAITDSVKKGGEWENKTEWHNITCFGKTAESAGKYLQKGNTAYIEGRIKTESWEDDNGVKKYKTVIIADKVMSLTKKESNTENQEEPAGDNAEPDLPF
jgi:single-strand DNA-binding protein